ncbi:MarR family transcriptional regulator [Verticiella sediminum]|uniref:MarR family transcriptional regulator n=1 Tax=Verticiella sediminum TaxID=1247510 RepID=A0A556AJB0_9BURK|nr:MarR family transcriptional regulator [Verticiella sediminum]TSH92977.1 MarR family transcriptional regulator [Verticiella sediminum]
MKTDVSHERLREAQELGHEARAHPDDHAALKLWLRMLACTTQIETEIRQRLRAEFDISLARFDYMAQLYRHPEGLMMRELSRQLMVTGGNVTGLTDELQNEGLVVRKPSPTDRRAWIVQLTPHGRTGFEAMARMHEGWIVDIFGGLSDTTFQQLYAGLGRLRVQMLADQPEASPPRRGPASTKETP